MKSFKLLAILVLTLAFATVNGFSQITNSGHDFTKLSWNTNGQICVFCHTPHNASATEKPLWNHTASSASYTMYNSSWSSTMDGTVASSPSNYSKVCLSCHDNTVALDAYGGSSGDATNHKIGNISGTKSNLGTDLTNDHPISVTYNPTADAGLRATSYSVSALGTGKTIADMLKGGNVECVSCHDVHNEGNKGKMLLMANTGSALCITCHNK
jgi:predicted CXXCH cytochrome family protein